MDREELKQRIKNMTSFYRNLNKKKIKKIGKFNSAKERRASTTLNGIKSFKSLINISNRLIHNYKYQGENEILKSKMNYEAVNNFLKSMDDKKKNRYFSNSPISSKEYYGEGVEAIDEMVANKDVFNIGVIAPYGAGKSSLIKTFKESNSLKAKRNKKKMAEISLLHLSEQDDNKKESSDKEPVKNKDALLEKSILEQLFFKEGRAKLPFSKIERIHNRVLTSFLVAFLVVVSTLSLLFAIMEYKKVLPWSNGNNLLVYIVVAAVSLLLTITSLILSFRIGKISFQNIEIEFNKIESGSVLNFFLDEIVYFFKNTKTDVVIFEDIERFGSVSLFTKLREINHVLNNNKRIKRKITFIYCVTDDFFAGERDRAKFFEFVISLVPILNPKNVNEHIVSCLKENNIELNDVFLKKISRFIADKRVLNDIINDFI